MQVDLIGFRKNIDVIHVYFCEARYFHWPIIDQWVFRAHTMLTAYSLDGSNWPRPN